MTPETRRSLATLLVGVIAALGGMAIATALRTRRCLEAGGAWDAAARACVGADGLLVSGVRGALAFWATAILAALVIAFMGWRLFTAATRFRR